MWIIYFFNVFNSYLYLLCTIKIHDHEMYFSCIAGNDGWWKNELLHGEIQGLQVFNSLWDFYTVVLCLSGILKFLLWEFISLKLEIYIFLDWHIIRSITSYFPLPLLFTLSSLHEIMVYWKNEILLYFQSHLELILT